MKSDDAKLLAVVAQFRQIHTVLQQAQLKYDRAEFSYEDAERLLHDAEEQFNLSWVDLMRVLLPEKR